MDYRDNLPIEWGKEKRYASQEIVDPVTGGKALLVHRWENFKDGYDVHVPKENNPLYDYLVKDAKAFLLIGFSPDVEQCFSLRMSISTCREDLENFVQFTEYGSVICAPTEFVYKDVKGMFIDNFEIIKLTDRRNYEFPID